jgi:hypothetical protein
MAQTTDKPMSKVGILINQTRMFSPLSANIGGMNGMFCFSTMSLDIVVVDR